MPFISQCSSLSAKCRMVKQTENLIYSVMSSIQLASSKLVLTERTYQKCTSNWERSFWFVAFFGSDDFLFSNDYQRITEDHKNITSFFLHEKTCLGLVETWTQYVIIRHVNTADCGSFSWFSDRSHLGKRSIGHCFFYCGRILLRSVLFEFRHVIDSFSP